MFGRTKKKLAKLEAELKAVKAQADRPDEPTGSRSLLELAELFGAHAATHAGPSVTPMSAMQTSAVFACVRILSEAIAGMSLPIFRRTKDGRERADHDLWWLLNEQPTSICTAASFWEWMMADMLLRGDGIAVIGRSRSGQVQELIPVPRDSVLVERKEGRLRYYVSTAEGPKGFDQDDVLHFPGFGFDGIQGMSVIKWAARQGIGIAISAQEMAGKFFANGAVPRFSLEIPGALQDAQVEQLRREWVNRYTGPDNAHMPLILTHGAKAAQLTVNPEDAQLLETRKFEVIDIARAFGVPPFMIGETEKTTSWGSGVEHMGMGFVRYTLRGPMNRIEQELNRKFWPRSMAFFVEFNADSLMRGDSKAESDSLRQALGGSSGPGWMTVNEIRRVKNLPPVEGGDVLYQPGMAAPVEAVE